MTKINVIDKFQDNSILKLVRANGTYLYQTMPTDCVGIDGSKTVQHKTLSDARKHIGMPAPKVVAVSRPKSSNPQNQKGYKAPAR